MSTTAESPGSISSGGPYDVDPQDIIDVIDGVRQTDAPIHSAGITVDDFTLPGFGDPYDDCGDPIPWFCENCARDFKLGRTCRRNVCERCAQSWCREQSTEIAARLESLRRKRQAEHDEHQRFHHLVFSPPWAEWTPAADDPYERTMQAVNDILDVFGLEGVALYHPWAGKVETGGDDVGEWKDRLFSGRALDDVLDEVMLRPHVHVVVVGHFVPGDGVTDVVEEETGWLIHRITKGNTDVSMYGVRDLARVVTYCLSHTGIRQLESVNSAQYRYWGQELNDIYVFDDVRRFVDTKVRAMAPRTLGIPYQAVACVADNRVNDDTHGYVSRVNLEDNTDGPPEDDGALEADREDLPGGGLTAPMGTNPQDGWDLTPWAADRDGGEADDFYLAEGVPSSHDTGSSAPGASVPNRPPDDAPGPWPDQPTCRGRVLPISQAPDYLKDPEWREQVPYADDLRDTYDEWRPKLDYLPDEDPFDDDPPSSDHPPPD